MSRKEQDELTGNIEIEDFLLLHSAVNQFLAGLIDHQNFPLLGGRVAVSIRGRGVDRRGRAHLMATGIADCVQYNYSRQYQVSQGFLQKVVEAVTHSRVEC